MAAEHDPQLYFHVRVVMGMILGLSITRLLSGFARFIQHPKDNQVSVIHLGWAGYTLLDAILFWWWEYRLTGFQDWTFMVFFFLLFYTSLFYFMCVLLFPDHLGSYPSYNAYFYAKRKWFFGLLAISLIMDIVDTLLKRAEYGQMSVLIEVVDVVILVAGCFIAMQTQNPRFHGAFLLLSMVNQIFWIGFLFNTIN